VAIMMIMGEGICGQLLFVIWNWSSVGTKSLCVGLFYFLPRPLLFSIHPLSYDHIAFRISEE